jgi:hypothetical protein
MNASPQNPSRPIQTTRWTRFGVKVGGWCGVGVGSGLVTWQLILQPPPAMVEIGWTLAYYLYLSINFLVSSVFCGVAGLVVGLILGAILDFLLMKR